MCSLLILGYVIYIKYSLITYLVHYYSIPLTIIIKKKLKNMEDIEDMFKNDIDANDDSNKRTVKNKVVRKNGPKKQEKKQEEEDKDEGVVIKVKEQKVREEVKEEGDEVVNGELPGKQKIFVKTYGCSHNISDSEYMAGLLAEYGFQIVDKMENADACLINSCTVKGPSQEKFIK